MTRLAHNEVEFRRRGERGAVRLVMSADLDVLRELNAEKMTVAYARELVAERRDAEKHEAEVLGLVEQTGLTFDAAEAFLAGLKEDFGDGN